MSMGYGALARKVLEDESTVIYSYSCWNNGNRSSISLDGIISIDKSCFIEPEVHKRIKRLPHSRKKEITKKVIKTIDIDKLIRGNKITVENCELAWRFSGSIDWFAIRIIEKLSDEYQEYGYIPIKVYLEY